MDLLCQEMGDACRGELRVTGFFSLLVFRVPKNLSGGSVTAAERGCDNKRKNLVRDMKEKERVRRALLSCAGWRVSFKFLE